MNGKNIGVDELDFLIDEMIKRNGLTVHTLFFSIDTYRN